VSSAFEEFERLRCATQSSRFGDLSAFFECVDDVNKFLRRLLKNWIFVEGAEKLWNAVKDSEALEVARIVRDAAFAVASSSGLQKDDKTGKDLIDTSLYAEKLAGMIVQKLETSFVIGLHAQWGSGKSFIMNKAASECHQLDAPPRS
jgi:hypothetical protein